jgi:hypothetical protein
MEKDINVLENQRKELYKQISKISDFRRGSISTNYRRCGKKNCVCSRPDHIGHGPQYLWNATIKGKSKAISLKLGPELEKVRQEVENHRKFVALSEELVKVNEEICNLRPIKKIDDQELSQLKKKLQRKFFRKSSKR